ncbi:uncharacterized protein LOC122931166 isoform X1 [Bufo gargarizans]|uniref:uncharacterized protein LOC122931166 isoform X1 n=2 Tax=Bufo gargarizans TaxID=30331 RepID=UPI001CF43E72|nr:uncharacterized protein LOC122931166 isoform X1 [Bufo gargarizans]
MNLSDQSGVYLTQDHKPLYCHIVICPEESGESSRHNFAKWKDCRMMKSKEITRFQLKTETQDWCKMARRVVAVIYIVLILGKEFQAEPIAVPGPSSGIMLQDTTGFILTNKRILSQKIYVSLDPRVFVERQFNISEISSPEIKIWYQMHIGYSQERVTQILEQTRKTMTREQFSTSRRPKRFISAITAAIIFAVVGTVIATGVSAVNSISVKTLELEIGSLKRNLMSIHAEMENQKKHLSDLYSVVEDTVVTTDFHSKLLTHSMNLHESHEQFKQELMSLKTLNENPIVTFQCNPTSLLDYIVMKGDFVVLFHKFKQLYLLILVIMGIHCL